MKQENIQKVCNLHNGISSNSTVSEFVNFTVSPPLCYSMKITNYGMRLIRRFTSIDWLARDLLQISLLLLNEFKRINQVLLPLKSSKNHRCSGSSRGNTI